MPRGLASGQHRPKEKSQRRRHCARFTGPGTYFEMVLHKKIGLDRDDFKWKNCTQNWQQRRGIVVSNAGLLLIGSGFDAAPGFHFILNVLGFLCVIRYGEE